MRQSLRRLRGRQLANILPGPLHKSMSKCPITGTLEKRRGFAIASTALPRNLAEFLILHSPDGVQPTRRFRHRRQLPYVGWSERGCGESEGWIVT